MSSHTKKKVLLINCDWRDIFRSDWNELHEKLERDHLGPDVNEFLIFSFAHVSYVDTKEPNFKTFHHKTLLPWLKPWLDIASIFLVPQIVRKEKFMADIVLVYDFGFLPAAWIIKKMTGAKIVHCINNMPSIYSATRKFGAIKSAYSKALEIFLKGIPDEYFTINDAMKSYLENLAIPPEKIHIFSMNTIVRDMKHVALAEKGIARKKWNIPEDAKVLICVARLEAEKNHERLLSLFASLSGDYHLFLLGQGSLKADILAQAERLGISGRIHLPGFVSRSEIWNYYLDSDVFVLLSKAEALGVVVWEAMYVNLPVLGSEAPGIVESTGTNGERGLVLRDSEGKSEFREKLSFLLGKSEEKERMVQRAKEYVQGKIDNNLDLNDIV